MGMVKTIKLLLATLINKSSLNLIEVNMTSFFIINSLFIFMTFSLYKHTIYISFLLTHRV